MLGALYISGIVPSKPFLIFNFNGHRFNPFSRLGEARDGGEGTDFHAVANGYASITPLTVDMTAHSSLESMTLWVDDLSI